VKPFKISSISDMFPPEEFYAAVFAAVVVNITEIKNINLIIFLKTYLIIVFNF